MKLISRRALRLSVLLCVPCLYCAGAAYAQYPNQARDLAANCFTCHGTNGNSVDGVPPGLAGRNRAELFQAMKDFQSGRRAATIMHQHAKGYTDEQLQLISTYFAALSPAPARAQAK